MNTSPNQGAKIRLISKQASINLSKLIELLAESINPENPDPNSLNPQNRPLFYFDSQRKRLKVCTSGVLRRFLKSPKFKESFKSSESGGFVQDFDLPKWGLTSKLGSQLTDGELEKLPSALENLLSEISQNPLSDASLVNLLLNGVERHLKTLSREFQTFLNQGRQTGEVKTLAFLSKTPSKDGVAKVISAKEKIDARDYFTKMYQAIADYLEQQDYDEDQIEEALKSLEAERERIDSQITRFLNFLEDEALARVRLKITLEIMTALAEMVRADEKHRLLVNYVDQVLSLINLGNQQGLNLDLTKHYGQKANFNLEDFLNQANFYGCLAVWAEAKAQIFEEKVRIPEGEVIQREISYRFRINGKNPDTSDWAFDSRLERIRGNLTERSSPYKINRSLAELIFLDAVVPSETIGNLTTESLLSHLQTRLNLLNETGEEGVKQIITDLGNKSPIMQQISRSLVTILKTKGSRFLESVKQRISQQFICVKRSIVDWSRLEGAEPGTQYLLVGSPEGDKYEQIEWFKHLEINDKPEAINLLFSVEISTQLSEHDLILKPQENLTLQAQRVIPKSLLQVLWVPYQYEFDPEDKTQPKETKESPKERKYKPIPKTGEVKKWALEAAIQIEYETRLLRQNPERKGDADASQYHAATVAAFAVLIYVSLWHIIQRLKSIQGKETEPFITLMLRLQAHGKDNSEQTTGEDYVYAVSQSIESILNQDTPLRMQGISLSSLDSSSSADWVKRGTFQALLSAFPLRITTQNLPSLSQIGMIAYATRPGDEHPNTKGISNQVLLTSKSYIATRIEQPFIGYEIRGEKTDLDIMISTDAIEQQRLIKEEIQALKEKGCNHIILMAHAYGGRRFNRTANYNTRLITTAFLEELWQNFPDLTLYPLLKDIFPATRLYNRQNEAGFEISRSEDHASFLQTLEMERIQDIIPVYSFATLTFVGKDEFQRPQSGFCTYFLFSDRGISNPAWTERARQHLLNADGTSTIHPCLISFLRGLHFLESEKVGKKGALSPVLNPFNWITPNTKEEAGEVRIFPKSNKGQTLLSFPALLTHVSQVLHRRP